MTPFLSKVRRSDKQGGVLWVSRLFRKELPRPKPLSALKHQVSPLKISQDWEHSHPPFGCH